MKYNVKTKYPAFMLKTKSILTFIFRSFALLRQQLIKFGINIIHYFKNFHASQTPPHLTSQQKIILTIDSLIAFFSLYFSAYVCEDEFSEYSSGFLLKNMLVFMMTTVSAFLILETHKKASTYQARLDYIPLTIAMTISTVCYYPLMLLMGQLESFSNSTPVVNLFLSILLMCVPRLIAEIKINHAFVIHRPSPSSLSASAPFAKIDVLLVGTLADIELSFKNGTIQSYPDFTPVAIITPEPSDFGYYIHDIPVIGEISALHEIINSADSELKFHYVFIVGQALSESEIYSVSKIAQQVHIPLMRLIESKEVEKTA